MDLVKKVVTAPAGHSIQVIPPQEESIPPHLSDVRLVETQEATPVRLVSYDDTHPHRQKEIIENVNRRLRERKTINSYDVLCVCRIHGIEDKQNYYFEPRHGSPQYSDAFIDWLVSKYEENNSFFEDAREQHRNLNS